MFDPNQGPRPTTDLDKLALGMLAAPAAVVGGAYTAGGGLLGASIWLYSQAPSLFGTLLAIGNAAVGANLATQGATPPEAVAGHSLLVTVMDAEGNILENKVVESGEMYGLFGHTETEAIQELWSTLKPGDTVIMQGQFPICQYGLCRPMLDAAARATGADIYYYAPTYLGGYSLNTFFGGVGFVPRSTAERLLIYLLGH